MAIVKIITAGNVIQTQTFDKVNRQPPKIKRLNASQWVNTETGEVYTPEIKESRKDTLTSSMSKLRDIINANTDNPANIRWVTLTYAENMTDLKKLLADQKKYYLRLEFYCLKKGYPKPEYITAIEPQERGAWHTHSLLIWQDKAPYISNKDLASIWKHGFVKINQPKNCDNFGAYLSAYLTDTQEGDKTTKKKGNRLHLYPPNCKFYRLSKGIKKPSVEWVTESKAEKIVQPLRKTYEVSKKLQFNDTESKITYRHYNRLPAPSQPEK